MAIQCKDARSNLDFSSTTQSNFSNRLAVFFFYDKDGIVDRYVDVLLSGMKEVINKLVVVVNGKLTPEGRELFNKHSELIIVRENKGLDVWAYKEALEYVGWPTLEEYDEVVLLNYTIMGPVYPFSQMFDKMAEQKELDFWGATKHLKIDHNPFAENKYGYIPEHIQSSFIVYRNKFIKTRELHEFWENMPEVHDYNESVSYYESAFTKHFADMGFRWNVYVNNSDEDFTNYLLMVAPQKALEEYKCPIFKRRSFFQDADYCYANTTGESALELLSYLKNHTQYDVNLIFENIIRTVNQYNIVRTLGLHYILSSEKQLCEDCSKKTALLIHAYYEDQMERTCHYAASMPADADIYITTPHKDQVAKIASIFAKLPNKVQIRLIENRGRDVSSLLVGCADLIDKYEYICFYHDKKVKQVDPKSVGSSFSYLVSESTLHNRTYVQNVINTFEENPKLGMLSSVPPCHGAYYMTLNSDWGPNYDNTVQLMEELGINAPISKDCPPVAPLGTVFWFRSIAMKKLFAKQWKYSDFPPEPNKVDGTLLHAVERIYPFVVQDAGYYPAYVLPDFIASMELSMMTHYLRSFNKVFDENNLFGTQLGIKDKLSKELDNSVAGAFASLDKSKVNSLIPVMSSASYGFKQAFAIAVNKRLPFLFKRTASLFPASKRTIGVKAAIDIWRIKRILRKW